MMTFFASMRTGSYSLPEPLRRQRATVAVKERVKLTDRELTNLGE